MDVKGNRQRMWDKKGYKFIGCSRPLSQDTLEIKSFEVEKYQGQQCCKPALCQLLAGRGRWVRKTFGLS